jgi:hypothetical protein
VQKYCAVVDNFGKKFNQRSSMAWFERLIMQKSRKTNPFIKIFTDLAGAISGLIGKSRAP